MPYKEKDAAEIAEDKTRLTWQHLVGVAASYADR